MLKISNNFTFHSDWINSLYARYDADKIICIGNLYFYKLAGIAKCCHFFDFNIDDNLLEVGLEKIRFSYINELTYNRIIELVKDSQYSMKIIDNWDAPILKINDIEYIETLKTRIKRNWKKYQNTQNKYAFKESDKNNILKLWKDVLFVDFNSWKRKKNSDMKSLDREDLQYVFYMIRNIDQISLKVIYDKDTPLAYSLMFKDNYRWYAVKWGASDEGRESDAGIKVLFSHIETLLSDNGPLYLDFWGRNNQFYDLLKNDSIKRYHLELELNNANKD